MQKDLQDDGLLDVEGVGDFMIRYHSKKWKSDWFWMLDVKNGNVFIIVIQCIIAK